MIDKISDDDFLDEIFVQNLLIGSLFYLKTYVFKNNQWSELIYNHSDIRSCVVGVEKFRFFTFNRMIEFDAQTGKIDVYTQNWGKIKQKYSDIHDFILNRDKFVYDTNLYELNEITSVVVRIFYQTSRIKRGNFTGSRSQRWLKKYGDTSHYWLLEYINNVFNLKLSLILNNFNSSHKSNLYCRLIYKVICASILHNHNIDIRKLVITAKCTDFNYHFAGQEQLMLNELNKIGINGFKKLNEDYQKMGNLCIFNDVHPFYFDKNRMSRTNLIKLSKQNKDMLKTPSYFNALMLKNNVGDVIIDLVYVFREEVFPLLRIQHDNFDYELAEWVKYLSYLHEKPVKQLTDMSSYEIRQLKLLYIPSYPKGKQLVEYFKKEKQSEQMVLTLIQIGGKARDCLLKSGNFDRTTQVCDLLNKKMKSGEISTELYYLGFDEQKINLNNKIRVI